MYCLGPVLVACNSSFMDRPQLFLLFAWMPIACITITSNITYKKNLILLILIIVVEHVKH